MPAKYILSTGILVLNWCEWLRRKKKYHQVLTSSLQLQKRSFRIGDWTRNWMWKVQKLKARTKHGTHLSSIVKYWSFRCCYLSRHHGCLSFFTCCIAGIVFHVMEPKFHWSAMKQWQRMRPSLNLLMLQIYRQTPM